MLEEKTVYDAMNEFANISQAVAFTTKEVALFHGLLQSWNAARRPAVIEQWARTTCHNTGLNEKSLSDTRNKLTQRGVIFWDKKGTRGVPKYSLNALFQFNDPFLPDVLPDNMAGKHAGKPSVNMRVNLPPYQGKEKEEVKEEKEVKSVIPLEEDFVSYCKENIPKSHPQWTIHQVELCALSNYRIYIEQGWKDGNGKEIINWKTKIKNKFKFEKHYNYGKDSQSANQSTQSTPQPFMGYS